MDIEFKGFEQWLGVKTKISEGFVPCPVCNQWTNDIRKVPERFRLYTSPFARKEYACVYCIAKGSGYRKKLEEDAQKPKCTTFHNCPSGFVYFLDCSHDSDGMVKIGTAKTMRNVRNRMSDAKRTYGLSCDPLLMRVIETNCGISLEHFMHDVFKKKRMYREMFVLDEEATRYILRLDNYMKVYKAISVFDPDYRRFKDSEIIYQLNAPLGV